MDRDQALGALLDPGEPPRGISITNTETGEQETFRVEVSDEVVREWLAVRNDLAPEPLSARPPDRVSDDYWVWFAREGEAIEGDDQGWRWTAPDGATLTLARTRRPAGLAVIEATTGADSSISGIYYLLRAVKLETLIEKMRELLADAGWVAAEGSPSAKPGFEDIPLDLSKVPSLEQGQRMPPNDVEPSPISRRSRSALLRAIRSSSFPTCR